jgi:hypothetical protein
MSDESPPQQEPRIKLKLRADKDAGLSSPSSDDPAFPESAPADALAPAEPTADETAFVPGKIKLKPRIIIKPDEPAAAEAPVAAVPVEPDPGLEPLPPIGTPKAAATEEEGKLKLKPPVPVARLSVVPMPALADDLPAEVVKIREASRAPIPVPPPPVAEPLPRAAATKPVPQRSRSSMIAVGGAGLLVLIAVGYFRHRIMNVAPPPPPPRIVAAPHPRPAEPKPAAVPTTTPPRVPETTLGKAVQSARDAVTAVAENRIAPTNEAAEAAIAPVPAAPALSAVPPAAASPAPAVKPAAIASTLEMPTPAAPGPVAGPNPRVRAFVGQLKIGGLRPGPPARLFIGGITFKAGDVIDPSLGVVFVGVDSHTEELLFQDGTGMVFRRRL